MTAALFFVAFRHAGVPLLYIAGLEAKVAAATSAFVVTCSGLSSFVSHLATAAQPQWGVGALQC